MSWGPRWAGEAAMGRVQISAEALTPPLSQGEREPGVGEGRIIG
jgi:hypothetical protein